MAGLDEGSKNPVICRPREEDNGPAFKDRLWSRRRTELIDGSRVSGAWLPLIKGKVLTRRGVDWSVKSLR